MEKSDEGQKKKEGGKTEELVPPMEFKKEGAGGGGMLVAGLFALGVAAVGGAVAYYNRRKGAKEEAEKKENEFEFEVENEEEKSKEDTDLKNVYLTPTGPGIGKNQVLKKDPIFEDPQDGFSDSMASIDPQDSNTGIICKSCGFENVPNLKHCESCWQPLMFDEK